MAKEAWDRPRRTRAAHPPGARPARGSTRCVQPSLKYSSPTWESPHGPGPPRKAGQGRLKRPSRIIQPPPFSGTKTGCSSSSSSSVWAVGPFFPSPEANPGAGEGSRAPPPQEGQTKSEAPSGLGQHRQQQRQTKHKGGICLGTVAGRGRSFSSPDSCCCCSHPLREPPPPAAWHHRPSLPRLTGERAPTGSPSLPSLGNPPAAKLTPSLAAAEDSEGRSDGWGPQWVGGWPPACLLSLLSSAAKLHN